MRGSYPQVIPRLSAGYPQFEQVYAQLLRQNRPLAEPGQENTKSIVAYQYNKKFGKQAYFSLVFRGKGQILKGCLFFRLTERRPAHYNKGRAVMP